METGHLGASNCNLSGSGSNLCDFRQITHLICARLKYDLYDFSRGVLGLLPFFFLYKKAQKTPPERVI